MSHSESVVNPFHVLLSKPTWRTVEVLSFFHTTIYKRHMFLHLSTSFFTQVTIQSPQQAVTHRCHD